MSTLHNLWNFGWLYLTGSKVSRNRLKNDFQRNYVYKIDAIDFFDETKTNADSEYLELFKKGFALDGADLWDRSRRFYQMIQFFKNVQGLHGEIAEAGCLFGLSAFLMCHYEKKVNPDFDGTTLHLFDSFKGLSKPLHNDLLGKGAENKSMQEAYKIGKNHPSDFMNRTQDTLHEFPKVNYNKGWIPELFKDAPKRKYKFVHLDLDMYKPTYDSLDFFYPQLVQGGCIVIDDYGFLEWPGVKIAADSWAELNSCIVVPLITGNAVIVKK